MIDLASFHVCNSITANDLFVACYLCIAHIINTFHRANYTRKHPIKAQKSERYFE